MMSKEELEAALLQIRMEDQTSFIEREAIKGGHVKTLKRTAQEKHIEIPTDNE